jgi:chemotaxis response regulator CheB
MITVYCIEGTDLYRDALSRIISRVRGLRLIGEEVSGLTGLEQINVLRPDIVILDSELPDTNGFEVVRALRNSYIPCIVIMVSDLTNPCIRDAVIAVGVDYFLDKFLESQKIGPILETLVHLFSGMEEEVPN